MSEEKDEPPKLNEYVPKNRCKTEKCINRKVIDGLCLSCYYELNKPLPKKSKGTKKNEYDVSGP